MYGQRREEMPYCNDFGCLLGDVRARLGKRNLRNAADLYNVNEYKTKEFLVFISDLKCFAIQSIIRNLCWNHVFFCVWSV